jgi:pimeloyl-ACP methyl ester carboxylesterase
LEQPQAFVARLDAAAEKRTTTAGGGTIQWRIWGRGEPVVLLHGGYGSWTHWIRNIEVLSRSYRLLVPDMPGYGDSPLPAGVHTMTDFAAILSGGLDQLIPGKQPFWLVGFSFGSSAASHLLQFDHRRIRRLVIIGTSGLGPRKSVSDRMQRWRDLPTVEARDAAHKNNLGVLMIHDPDRVDPLAVYLQSRNAERTKARQGMIKPSGDRKQLLSAHPVPLAGIWGARDRMSESYLDVRAAALREIDPKCAIRAN